MTLILCPRCRLWHVPGRPETAQAPDVATEVIGDFIAAWARTSWHSW